MAANEQEINRGDEPVDEIEQRVLDTARDLFVHYGYDKTTMNDIAHAANVAKSTIYTRWKKKEGLFEALVWRESRASVTSWFDAVEADPQGGSYGAWMRHALASFFNNPFLRAIYRRDRRVLGAMLQRMGVQTLYMNRIELFRNFLRQMQAVGNVRQELDEHALTYLLNSMQLGLIQMGEIIPNEHSPPIEDVFDVMVEMIERMVTPEDGIDHEAGKAILRQLKVQIDAALEQYQRTG